MNSVAVFPGQGAQRVGMGRALAEAFPAARSVFEEVDAALGDSLSRLIFEGPEEALTLTRNAQPALFATSLAALRAVESLLGRPLGRDLLCVAGHSLGEYSALAAARCLSIADGARLLRLRGEAMQEAVPPGVGAMAAIMGLSVAEVEAIAAQAADGEVCELANDNVEGQAVVSGHRPAVERALELARERGARRSTMLRVSAPFHCRLMQPAAERLAEALARVRLEAPVVPLIANVTAAPEGDPEQIRRLLAAQVTARVRWRESMARMREMGVVRLFEFGTGRVLSGLARRGLPGVETVSIEEPEQVYRLAEALS